jgi:hypothetical protein
MKNLNLSTTKFVFIMIAMAVIIFTYLGKIDAKDFFGLAMVVFYHYYNKPKDNTTQPVEKQVDVLQG